MYPSFTDMIKTCVDMKRLEGRALNVYVRAVLIVVKHHRPSVDTGFPALSCHQLSKTQRYVAQVSQLHKPTYRKCMLTITYWEVVGTCNNYCKVVGIVCWCWWSQPPRQPHILQRRRWESVLKIQSKESPAVRPFLVKTLVHMMQGR
jgi:hypothetical protein